MGTKRILVDATHQEQTRVALIDGNQIEDFEVEVASKKPLKGNIYLARISRIEPSLQAAFVEYGGNRHGFLPFSEIHSDYFLISDDERKSVNEFYEQKRKTVHADILETTPTSVSDNTAIEDEDIDEDSFSESNSQANTEKNNDRQVSTLSPHRHYNIQDVLKRRQIILVQVTKEERGNKGAALTTYLSIAGRYCVLMPNTNHTGGISRRIASVGDRRRLRDILRSFQMPKDMAMIVRTAGSQKSRMDIQRDYEYLLRVWSSIRSKALNSYVPSVLYEEADLLKRTIRDMYSRDINEILISGKERFESTREFMRMLIPSRVEKLRLYQDKRIPLFERWGTEKELERLLYPEASLPSGGYLIINPTEALIAIDVNSGKSTKETSIENTALATNMEAATQVARQLRLRNLAGLVVIDFIDMEVGRHRTMVENRLREALNIDRSRIQVGHISPFGLLELSRQRTSPSLIEAIATPCQHCSGHGIKWSVEAAGLQVIRNIEAELMKSLSTMLIHTSESSALWILNEKRDWITQIEKQHDIRLSIVSDKDLHVADFRIKRIAEVEKNDEETPSIIKAPEPIENKPDENKNDIEETAENTEQLKQRRQRRRRMSRKKNDQNMPKKEAVSNSSDVQPKAEVKNPSPEVTPSPIEPPKKSVPQKKKEEVKVNIPIASKQQTKLPPPTPKKDKASKKTGWWDK